MRKLVLPGELIEDPGSKLGQGVFRGEDGTRSSVLGLLDVRENYLRVIPLAGGYMPKENDFVVGVVSDAQSTYWILDINSPYTAILPARDYLRELRGNEKLGDVIPVGTTVYVRIKEVTRSKGVFTTLNWKGTRVLKKGLIVEVSSSKVPRIIGKKDSMIKMLMDETGCRIIAGQNGVIWIDGDFDKTRLAFEAIDYIENHSHQSGLTEFVKKMIIKKRGEVYEK